MKTNEVRDAIDAVLAHREVAVPHTGVFGCSTKWKEKHAAQVETLHKIESQTVPLEMASAGDLKKLRSNPGRIGITRPRPMASSSTVA